ncbi:MAG TPA: hypothetical protein PLE10_01550 [Brevefilum sp.]|nr:hypothetical protein [Brevefilum sp.]
MTTRTQPRNTISIGWQEKPNIIILRENARFVFELFQNIPCFVLLASKKNVGGREKKKATVIQSPVFGQIGIDSQRFLKINKQIKEKRCLEMNKSLNG